MTQNNRAEVSDARLAELLIEVEDCVESAESDAAADDNPQLAVDPVGEFDLAELRSIITELQDRRARPAAPEGEWVAPNEPDDPNWHIERMDAIVRELWATNNLDLHMCDGSVRKGQTGFLDNIRDSWRHIRRALSTSHPEPSEVQVTEAMVEAGCRALFGDQRWPVGFGFEAATGAKIGMRAALTAALSQSQPAPQPDDEEVEWPHIVQLGRALGMFASAIKSGEPWTATLQSEYDKANVAIKDLWADLNKSAPTEAGVEEPIVTFEVVTLGSGMRSLRRMEPELWWGKLPDGQYSLYLTPQPVHTDAEPEVVAWRVRHHTEDRWQAVDQSPENDPYMVSERLIRLSDHNTIVERLEKELADLKHDIERSQSALTLEATARVEAEERSARLREALEKAINALQVFADKVFNDNGNLTVNTLVTSDELSDAYFAHRKLRAALHELKGGE